MELSPPLVPGDRVLDLACGDAGQADFLLQHGLVYAGVDASQAMVEAARARGLEVHLADLNDFAPDEPVAATTIFRAIYYARDRRKLFRRIASYTEKKLVFDLNPRQYRIEDVHADLVAAGLPRLELRPFFQPQRLAVPAALLRTAEAIRPLARLALRFRFSYLCSASRG